MKRYWVFIYQNFYPSGGMTDFKKSFDEEYEAIDYITAKGIEIEGCKGHIFDTKEFVIVQRFDCDWVILGAKLEWYDQDKYCCDPEFK